MTRLSDRTLVALAGRGIRLPGYDRAGLRPGLVHLGVGAFHRCHQADYLEDLLEAGRETRFVTGLTLRPPLMAPQLGPQDGLYTRTLVDGETRDLRVIGGLREVRDDGSVALLSRAEMTVCTLTVTEKGYCHVPATGALNLDHPEILADLATDMPTSLPGVLVAALARRRATHGAGMTLISCDNVPANGAMLRGVVLEMARQSDPALADWIEAKVNFPSTMVDRIVPATTEADRAATALALGLEDAAPVLGEPFRQWVIEASPAPDLPDWAAAGAQIVLDVEPYEAIKMRVLNGTQSAMAHIGCLLGLATTADGIRHPGLRAFLTAMQQDETAATLPLVEGMAAEAYLATTFRRLENRALRHTNHQIATDGSQKIVQRLLRPAEELRQAQRPVPLLAAAAAGWAAYLSAAAPRHGARWHPSDPLAARVAVIAAEEATTEGLAARILRLGEVFSPALAADAGFARPFAAALHGWLTRPAEAVLAELCPAESREEDPR